MSAVARALAGEAKPMVVGCAGLGLEGTEKADGCGLSRRVGQLHCRQRGPVLEEGGPCGRGFGVGFDRRLRRRGSAQRMWGVV